MKAVLTCTCGAPATLSTLCTGDGTPISYHVRCSHWRDCTQAASADTREGAIEAFRALDPAPPRPRRPLDFDGRRVSVCVQCFAEFYGRGSHCYSCETPDREAKAADEREYERCR